MRAPTKASLSFVPTGHSWCSRETLGTKILAVTKISQSRPANAFANTFLKPAPIRHDEGAAGKQIGRSSLVAARSLDGHEVILGESVLIFQRVLRFSVPSWRMQVSQQVRQGKFHELTKKFVHRNTLSAYPFSWEVLKPRFAR